MHLMKLVSYTLKKCEYKVPFEMQVNFPFCNSIAVSPNLFSLFPQTTPFVLLEIYNFGYRTLLEISFKNPLKPLLFNQPLWIGN